MKPLMYHPWRPSQAAAFHLFTARNAGRIAVIALALAIIVAFTWRREDTRRERTARAATDPYKGFDVSNATIPLEEILSGGPPKDGIPAILRPKFVSIEDADFMRDDDKIVGVVRDGVARAYPLRILVWHEIVNDVVAGQPVAVTYCPLCGTCMVFKGSHGGKKRTFGVSGLLYQSDVLMYDHQTESLWSQLKMESVAGEHAGDRLEWLPSEEMTWKAWRERYPGSEVLSTDTGFGRSYGGTGRPYARYEQSDRLMFPVPKHRDELSNKEWVVGIIVNGAAKAYPVARLEELGGEPLSDIVGGQAIAIAYDPDRQSPSVKHAGTGERIPHVSAYWFAWQAFYPATELYGEG